MSGTRPKFLENMTMNESYYSQPNPYMNAPSCQVNLLELSRYARQQRKTLAELTLEEVRKFELKSGYLAP
jgi:hypothetical protein